MADIASSWDLHGDDAWATVFGADEEDGDDNFATVTLHRGEVKGPAEISIRFDAPISVERLSLWSDAASASLDGDGLPRVPSCASPQRDGHTHVFSFEPPRQVKSVVQITLPGDGPAIRVGRICLFALEPEDVPARAPLPVPVPSVPPGDFDVNRLKGMLDDIGVPLGGPAQAKLRDLERQQAAGPSSLRGLMDTYGPMLGELKGSAMLQPLMGLMMSNPSGTLPQGIAASLAEVGGAVERQRKEAAMERERQEEEKRTIQTEETAQVQVTETMIETIVRRVVREEMNALEGRILSSLRSLLLGGAASAPPPQPPASSGDIDDLD